MDFKGILFNNIKFKLIDVLGDGNCLYHSLEKSGIIDKSFDYLRSETFERILEIWKNGCNFVKKLYASYGKNIPLSHYAKQQKQDGRWGSTLDMCFFSIVFSVNIVSISNTSGGLKQFSVYDCFRTLSNTCNYVLDDAPTIWIYHHFGSVIVALRLSNPILLLLHGYLFSGFSNHDWSFNHGLTDCPKAVAT